jgi:2-methylcitrate dehydratase PrpD
LSATGAILDHAMAPAPPVPGAVISRLVRDTLVVGAAGAAHPDASAILAAARRWGRGEDCAVLGSSERMPAPAAAFVNGFRIHCLEWDAVHEEAVVHALSAVTAAASAVADREGAPDAERLAAIAVGVEIACLLGVAATSPLRFFRPATAGAVGAAVACGRLLGLSRDRMADALALGVAQAAGTMQAHVEGSVALPVQVGMAARAGVSAADLAAAGVRGPSDPLEGAFGYFPLFDAGSPGPHAARLGRFAGEVSIKPWPCGRASHGVLDALARAGGREVVRIEAFVPPLVKRLVGRPWREGMGLAEARLCLPFLVALMLRDGLIDPRAFTPAAFADPGLRALAARLELVDDGNADPNALAPQRLLLSFAGGDRQEVVLEAVLGSPAAPLSDEQLRAKWALAADLGGPDAGLV